MESNKGAFYTKEYTNLFEKCGYAKEDVDKRLEEIFQTIFYGSEEERFYHEVGDDMGYLTDTGNDDVRTEGMSYGMMMCVQLNKKKEFDRIWKWAYTYMYMQHGLGKGYFAWSCALNGKKNSYGPAPDGEEYFAMALLFASHRFGDGEGIFNYSKHARTILHDMIHKGEKPLTGHPMFNPDNKLIKFVPDMEVTDPSYHLPHFYELFGLWAEEEDRAFFKEAAACSREYLQIACHKETGLNPEYSLYDGTPFTPGYAQGENRHDLFFSDAYRTAMNLGLDYSWFEDGEWECEITGNVQKFLMDNTDMETFGKYYIDGTLETKGPIMHPVALLVTTAAGSLACGHFLKNESDEQPEYGKYAKEYIKRFYELPLRTGERRYYDNCLYLFAFMALSGNYRIW